MSVPIDVAVGRLARRHGGHVSRVQLLELGLSASAIDRRLRLGRLLPVHCGVYAVGSLPTTGEDRARGALLACGGGSMMSHTAAFTLWGLSSRWVVPLEVTVPRPGGQRRRRGIIVHTAISLTRHDLAHRQGIPVTSLARTLVDVAPRLGKAERAAALNDARVMHRLSNRDLEDALFRFRTLPGAKLMVVTYGGAGPSPSRSELERAFRRFVKRYGLPEPLYNVVVGGREVDVYFPGHGLIVELDGDETHNTPFAFESDRLRDAGVFASTGLPTVRTTWDRLHDDPDAEAERFRAILARCRAIRIGDAA
jgi:hypothetical protein